MLQLLSGAQSAAMLVASSNGLGESEKSHSEIVERVCAATTALIEVFQETATLNVPWQAFYTATLLFVPAVFLSKVSIILFMRGLTPIKSHQAFGLALLLFTTAWALGSEIAAALQCPLPSPWRSHAATICFNVVSPSRSFFADSECYGMSANSSLPELLGFFRNNQPCD